MFIKIIMKNDSGADNDESKYYFVEYDHDNGDSGVVNNDDDDDDWC